jgi:pectate lyase
VQTTTGGAGAPVVVVTNSSDLDTYMDSNNPYIIFISGTIDLGGMRPLRSNKTLIGINNATLTNGGLELYNRSNIIIRNITFLNATDDAIKINQNTHHIWVDHCTMASGADGLFDITRQSSYITISWNHFLNHSKTMLIGHSDSYSQDVGYLKTSVHHNWFDGTDSRHPRVRYGEVHVYNNYFLNNLEYGVASAMEADVVMEGNYFENVDYPAYVGYAESGPGDLVERFNVYVNSGAPQTRGSAFNPSQYYSYNLDDAASARNEIINNAGAGVIDPYEAVGVAPF